MTPLRDRTAWLQGGDALCLQPPIEVKRTWRLVLLGPPGVGKRILANLLFNALGVCPLSTGDLFRVAGNRAAAPGPEMAAAQAQMRRGELVTDETVMHLIRERTRCLHCRGGFLLDGFPRTLAQAQALADLFTEEKIALDAVISLELPIDKLVARLSGRRVCPGCQSVFDVVTQKPLVDGVCDQCGTSLVRRPDDHPESVCVRLEAYANATAPVADYYQKQRVLIRIQADSSPNDALAKTLDGLVALGMRF